MTMDVFEVLGILPTKDKKEIKKAYARLAKQHHPEEEPEKWQEIYNAYHIALELADNGKNASGEEWQETHSAYRSAWKLTDNERNTENEVVKRGKVPQADDAQSKRNQKEYHSVYENEIHKKIEEENELGGIFENLDDLASEAMRLKKEEEQYQIYEAIKELRRLPIGKGVGFDEWNAFFQKEEYQWAIRQGEFLYEWGRVLGNKTIDEDLAELMCEVLKKIIEYNQSVGEKPKTEGLLNPYQFLALKIEKSLKKEVPKTEVYKKARKYSGQKWIMLFIAAVLIRVIVILAHDNAAGDKQQKAEELIQNLQEAGEARLVNTYNIQSEWNLSIIDQKGEKFQKKVFLRSQSLADGIYITGEHNYHDALSEDVMGSSAGSMDEQSQKILYQIKEIAVPDEIDTPEGKVILPDEASGFVVFSSERDLYAFLWCDQETLNIEDGVFYCFDGEQYNRIWRQSEKAEDDSTKKCSYEMLGYRVFSIRISEREQKEFPIIFVPAQ